MKQTLRTGLILLLCVGCSAGLADEDERKQFTFSWPFALDDAMRPRGGTSTGTAVELAAGLSDAWRGLREPGLSKFERDRRAILAMAGGYRTSLEFIETVGFLPDFEPARPYQSWSTEYVYVIEDAGTEISLQHIIVMFYIDGDGETQGPIVQKHWRQDWAYQDLSLHEYVGLDRWQARTLAADEADGHWSQAVFQVDDSPRYEAVGEWVHDGNYSSWISDETWRPLPRRESSVRDDYQVLIGTNRHTITPQGWAQEEENLKVALDETGQRAEGEPYLSRELGLNRYERIVNFDFDAGDEYWQATSAFWDDVRAAWDEVFAGHDSFVLADRVDGALLFQPMFEYAYGLETGSEYDAEDGRAFIGETLARYIN